uniref:Uncharacterized protein n=1 Tax=Physcomitrium patens TaxID=3218 RepID=A0A2K1JV17_PHYPA|nr:hypothetical protein PHYPA_015133 [Physcomitrium patens]
MSRNTIGILPVIGTTPPTHVYPQNYEVYLFLQHISALYALQAGQIRNPAYKEVSSYLNHIQFSPSTLFDCNRNYIKPTTTHAHQLDELKQLQIKIHPPKRWSHDYSATMNCVFTSESKLRWGMILPV